jgi:hypothetical protein
MGSLTESLLSGVDHATRRLLRLIHRRHDQQPRYQRHQRQRHQNQLAVRVVFRLVSGAITHSGRELISWRKMKLTILRLVAYLLQQPAVAVAAVVAVVVEVAVVAAVAVVVEVAVVAAVAVVVKVAVVAVAVVVAVGAVAVMVRVPTPKAMETRVTSIV